MHTQAFETNYHTYTLIEMACNQIITHKCCCLASSTSFLVARKENICEGEGEFDMVPW